MCLEANDNTLLTFWFHLRTFLSEPAFLINKIHIYIYIWKYSFIVMYTSSKTKLTSTSMVISIPCRCRSFFVIHTFDVETLSRWNMDSCSVINKQDMGVRGHLFEGSYLCCRGRTWCLRGYFREAGAAIGAPGRTCAWRRWVQEKFWWTLGRWWLACHSNLCPFKLFLHGMPSSWCLRRCFWVASAWLWFFGR